jgi:hypothetical protein
MGVLLRDDKDFWLSMVQSYPQGDFFSIDFRV